MSSDALFERVERLERELSELRSKAARRQWSVGWRFLVLLWLVGLSIYTFTPARTPFERRLHLDGLTFQDGKQGVSVGPRGFGAWSTGEPLVSTGETVLYEVSFPSCVQSQWDTRNELKKDIIFLERRGR
jgi:hypothetical protein